MRRTLLALALGLISVPAASEVNDCTDVSPPEPKRAEQVFYVCHADGKYWSSKGEWKPLAAGATLRVPSGKTEVTVLATNTALFEYQLSSEPVDSPEGKQLNTFLKAFGPYLLDVPATELKTFQRELGPPDLTTATTSLMKALQKLDRRIDGLRSLRVAVLKALAKEDVGSIRRSLDASLEVVFRKVGDQEQSLPADRLCERLFPCLADALLDSYREVEETLSDAISPLHGAETALSDRARERAPESFAEELTIHEARGTVEDVSKLVASARKALDESGEVFELLRRLERLTEDGLAAENYWTSPPFPISLEKGRKVTFKVTRKPAAAIASQGRLPDLDTTFTLQPSWSIRPAVGLSLLYVEDAVHPTFGTSKTKVTEDGAEVERFRVVEEEFEDNRFTYGLTLGLTHRKLCGPEGKSCSWLDFTVNPSDDVQALGVGLSWNWSRFRLGGGALWTKHDELANGLRLDDLLAAEGDLKTRETYGDPELYLTFSIIGWQPFVSE